MTPTEIIARAIFEAEVEYSMNLTRLVDGVHTYTLTLYKTREVLEFDNTEDLYALVVERKRLAGATAALTALDAAGYQVVPKVASDAMLDAAADGAYVNDGFANIYRAMLAEAAKEQSC